MQELCNAQKLEGVSACDVFEDGSVDNLGEMKS